LDEMKKVRTWVGASYAVHPDMKSHTRCLMLFGTGGLFRKSSKLKTKSSTEAEHVGASNYLPNLPYFSVLCLPRCPVYTRQNLSAFACIFSSRFPRLLLYWAIVFASKRGTRWYPTCQACLVIPTKYC
jgi:hypothetical protein